MGFFRRTHETLTTVTPEERDDTSPTNAMCPPGGSKVFGSVLAHRSRSHAQNFFLGQEFSGEGEAPCIQICSIFQSPSAVRHCRIGDLFYEAPGGTSNVWRFSIATGWAATHIFSVNSEIFFLAGAGAEKLSRNSGWGEGVADGDRDQRYESRASK